MIWLLLVFRYYALSCYEHFHIVFAWLCAFASFGYMDAWEQNNQIMWQLHVQV